MEVALVSQLLSSLCSAASKYLTAVCRSHSLQETVLFLTMKLFRLICPLHDKTSSLTESRSCTPDLIRRKFSLIHALSYGIIPYLTRFCQQKFLFLAKNTTLWIFLRGYVIMVIVSRNSNYTYCFDTKSLIWWKIFKENFLYPLK